MRRWLGLSIGLGFAGAALYALLTVGEPAPAPAAASGAKARARSAPVEHETIDAASRAELREVLRESASEADGAGAP